MQNIIILDFGSRYLQLIARRLRELGVHHKILPFDASVEEINKFNPAGFILSGGPDSVYLPGSRQLNKDILEMGLPILGICYGLQLFAHTLGGKVERMSSEESGEVRVRVVAPGQLISRADSGSKVWMHHGDHVTSVPRGFKLTATSKGRVCIIENHAKKFYGVQFHPEVAYCPIGSKLLLNFINICNYKRDQDSDFIIYP